MNREEPPDALTIVMHFFLLQTHFGISSLSHPVNALEVCGLLTPLHIVPEWYFLHLSINGFSLIF